MLLDRIADPALRDQLTAEVEALNSGRKFGLVFEGHAPEAVRIPNAKVRRGSTVQYRDGDDQRVWKVARAKAGEVTLVHQDGERRENVLVTDLVAARELGDPVYPGFIPTGTIEQGGDKPHHLVIQGENYHALQTLLYTHKEAVDLIYIDPPYNTGNKGWQYNDKYVSQGDQYAHSLWLSFMEKRLLLARELLAPTGAIMVSIGDHEQHRLRMLMDQIFGERNLVNQVVVEMSTTSGPKTTNAQQGTIVKNVEYVLIYRKSPAFDTDIKHTPLYDAVKGWDKDYSLWLNDDGTITSFYDELVGDSAVWADIVAAGLLKKDGKFLGAQAMDRLLAFSDSANEFVEQNLDRIARRDTPPVSVKNVDAPIRGWVEVEVDHRSYYVTRLKSGTINQVYTLRRNYRVPDEAGGSLGRTVIRGDLWRGFHLDMGTVSREGGVAFANGKKPIRLIKQLVRWANNAPDAVILDFFGGSGTTAHAIMSMNADDQGQRQSIVVTNNELAAKDADRLEKAGVYPGSPEWESHGVFETVTRQRVENVLREGFEENVSFLKLDYLQRDDVELGKAFRQVAELLWVKAGSVGPVITELGESFAFTDRYGILFDTDRGSNFEEEAASRGVHMVFVITDSAEVFGAVRRQLHEEIRAVHLYRNYLSNFEINTRKVI